MLVENVVSWFKKHLNWTAVIIIFGGLIFSLFAAIIALGFNLFLFPQLLPFEFRIFSSLAVVLTTLASIIGIIWLIKNKRRHWAFVLFFIPYGLFSILILPMLFPGFLLGHSFYHYGPSFLAILFAFFLIPAGFWLIGLIVILLLKEKGAEAVQFCIDPLLDIQNENNVNRRAAPLRQIIKSKSIRVSCSLLLLAIIIAVFSCVRMNTGYQTVTIKNYNSSRNENLHYSQISFECPKSYYPLMGEDLFWYLGDEATFVRDQIKLFSLESAYIQIDVSPSSKIKEGNPVSSSLVEQCIYFYCQSASGRFPAEYSIKTKDLKIANTTVDGISADYAVFSLDDSISLIVGGTLFEPRDKIELVCFEREGIVWTIQMRADRADSSSYSDFNQTIKSFRITP
jgi:hypothetical protein